MGWRAMIVAVPRENHPGERRIALIPASIPPLTKAGLEILIETGAGQPAGYSDQQYAAKGAKIAPSRKDAFAADIVLQVRAAAPMARPDWPTWNITARAKW